MRINGKELAQDIQRGLLGRATRAGVSLSLGVLTVGDDPITSRYLGVKRAFGESVGVSVLVDRADGV